MSSEWQRDYQRRDSDLHPDAVPAFEALAISLDELAAAQLTPRCFIENYLYADVGSVVAPGGTGKTTLQLYEAICYVLGREVHGLRVIDRGWWLFITAEDQREQLVARLREIMHGLDLNEYEVSTVLERVRIWDVTGESVKLVRAMDGNIVPTSLADEIITAFRETPPTIITFDPLISFGASEQAVNDNEQAIITAARRIVRALNCCVRVVAHTGKVNAREKTLDQYSSRGGSALSDGARMVTVLQVFDGTGNIRPPVECAQNQGSSITILARPKLSYAPGNLPLIWIKRTGWRFESYADIQLSPEARNNSLLDRIENFLAREVEAGRRHLRDSLADASVAAGIAGRAEARSTIGQLMAQGRIIELALPKLEQRTRRKTYLGMPPKTAASSGDISNPTGGRPW